MENSLDNLQKIKAANFSDLSVTIDTFFELQEDNYRFRTFIRDYIKSIAVYREKIVFCLDYGFGLLDDITKEYTCERTQFKTPGQRL